MLAKKAITIPNPAITPSSDTPRYAVGSNARKPSAIPAAASASEPPTSSAALKCVDPGSAPIVATLRYATAYWMPKSTPSPTNSTANATEIRLNAGKIISPKLAVSASPTTRHATIATTVRTDRTASHSIPSRRDQHHGRIDHRVFLERAELLVGHRDVAGEAHAHARRRVELRVVDHRADRARRARAGLQRAEVQQRTDQHEAPQLARIRGFGRRASSATTKLQVGRAGRSPASWRARRVRAATSRAWSRRGARLRARARGDCISPRTLGSAASVPSTGCAETTWSSVFDSSSTSRNSRPLCSKNAPPSGRRTSASTS